MSNINMEATLEIKKFAFAALNQIIQTQIFKQTLKAGR